MKIYKIKVNGKAYEVEVETVTENNEKIQVTPSAAAQSTGEAKEVKAPMAGTILDVKVSVGQMVNVGDVLVILEAMKLENEVKSQVAGKVTAINVSKGSAVKNGDVIIIVA
jgi:biotin carboxyl carrier protein